MEEEQEMVKLMVLNDHLALEMELEKETEA
jgi:hypothetical protein